MGLEAMLGSIGKEVDAGLVDWRQKGVRGDDAARARFYQEQYQFAKAMMRLAVGVKLITGSSPSASEALGPVGDSFLEAAEGQADESGFDLQEKAYYMGITQAAISSLAEEYRAEA